MRRDQAGFTLVGVLVAIVIVSLGLSAILSAQVMAYGMQTTANLRTTAVEIARAHMEVVKTRDPLTLVAEAKEAVNETGAPDAAGAYAREVTVGPGGDGLKEIRVLVDYPRSRKPVELVTLIYHREF